jgi:hypothetical protein
MLVVLICALGVLPSAGNLLLGSSTASANASVGRTVTSVHMYLIALGDNGKSGRKIGCGDSLIPVTVSVAPTHAPLLAAYRVLLSDHNRYYGQSGLYNPLYRAHLGLQGVQAKSGRANAYLTGSLNLGGECDDPRVKAQLRQTAFQFPSVHRVAIYLNGVSLSKVLSGKG